MGAPFDEEWSTVARKPLRKLVVEAAPALPGCGGTCGQGCKFREELGMRASVLAAFPSFTDSLEGWVIWPYLDVKGLATVGRGDLVDPFSPFSRVPWQLDGRPATDGEIVTAWSALKSSPPARIAAYYANVTALRLTKEQIDELSLGRLSEMETVLRSRFAEWDSLPADAQLAVVSMSWACGPAFRFPKLEAALRAEDFATCAAECAISEVGNAGIAPRNQRNRALFLAAQAVMDQGGDPELLTG
jgi:GH24 family phage-related lysozyme (muramidase)